MFDPSCAPTVFEGALERRGEETVVKIVFFPFWIVGYDLDTIWNAEINLKKEKKRVDDVPAHATDQTAAASICDHSVMFFSCGIKTAVPLSPVDIL